MQQPTGFSEFGLGRTIELNLEQLGIKAPTPVQQEAIPMLMAGNDLIASAPTGTGKTAAFLLPALSRLQEPSTIRGIGPRILVLTPTRELAQQVAKAAIDFSRHLAKVKTVCVTGGESYFHQNKALTGPHEILVATPGRLMDQMRSGRIDFSRLEVLVLDEADRMLDMGFSDDVMAIAEQLPAQRQTVCFTATMSRSVMRLSGELQRDPKTIEVKAAVASTDAIDQHVVYVDNFGHKRRLLSHWLNAEAEGQIVIFTATKRDAESLAEALDGEGHATVALHGDLEQRQRTRMLNRLRRGEARVLVATDVAARGIDVAGITHVFNFDLPRFAEDYVHRIGRTGRAGASGVAISFVGRDDVGVLRRIERFIGRSVKVTTVEGMEADFKPGERRPGGGRPHGGARRFDDRRPQNGFVRRDGQNEPRRSFGDRSNGFGDRPQGEQRRSFGDRDGSAPRREGFGERREGGFGGERREGGFGGERREGGFGQRREGFGNREGFGGNREGGERRPAWGNDRPSEGRRNDGPRSFGNDRGGFGGERREGRSNGGGFGERKSFGDRGGFGGERKSFGDRPRRKFD